MQTSDSQTVWQKTQVQNLVRYVPSKKFFARFRAGGKIVRKSLKTNVLSVAKLRLPDVMREHRAKYEASDAVIVGKMTFGQAAEIFKEKTANDASLKPRSKSYRVMLIDFIVRSWPELPDLDIRKIGERDCQKWLGRFQNLYAAIVVNNAIGTLRAIFSEGVDAGARFSNPAAELKRVKIRPKILKLPSREQFLSFVRAIETAGARQSKDCANLVRFLAYSGARIGEVGFVTWADVNFAKNEIQIYGDPETATKNGEVRSVPMIPELHEMLAKLRKERSHEPLNAAVMQIRKCQNSMNRAAKIAGMERITHHDLRHLFATICIESGVDIPTVSRWLGHKDGGALCMKTYGHLRQEHSAAQAQRVRFNAPLAAAA